MITSISSPEKFSSKVSETIILRVFPQPTTAALAFRVFSPRAHSKIPHTAVFVRRQPIDSILQILIFYRPEFKEQRQEEDRCKVRHQNDKCNKDQAGIEPPVCRRRAKQPVDYFHPGDAQRN